MMAFTINDAIGLSRRVIQDTRPNHQRHSDEVLLSYLNMAFAEAWRYRPDLFSWYPSQDWGVPPSYTINDMDADFPVEQQYFTPVALYIAGMVGLEDDEYANDGRAAALINNFERALVGRTAILGRVPQ